MWGGRRRGSGHPWRELSPDFLEEEAAKLERNKGRKECDSGRRNRLCKDPWCRKRECGPSGEGTAVIQPSWSLERE